MSSDPRAATIVRSTIELSHQLGMLMVAEGVEDAVALQMLREAGCDVAQGYHVARPMAAAQLTQWLDAPTSPCSKPLASVIGQLQPLVLPHPSQT
jgi:EAL domain-containing protein (putative c-di-GMP-specific phosphodiesterase class I)